ncbi:hypothetical protein ACFP3Q_11120 [Nocardioides sp. GCM10027113]|uniref:hypothetical protein n=1 Tax=unclassified Nocardioides TaxID=2615069 RepID=UPI00361C84D0
MPVAPGEKVLASAETVDGRLVAGTRDALYLPPPVAAPCPVEGASGPAPVRLPWEEVESADWDQEASVLRVREVGSWGEHRVQHVLALDHSGLFLQLVRERVTASVVLQRHVRVDGRRGLRVIARRAPRGDRPIAWFYEFDEGVDPADPFVRQVAEDALTAARQELGEP